MSIEDEDTKDRSGTFSDSSSIEADDSEAAQLLHGLANSTNNTNTNQPPKTQAAFVNKLYS